MERKRKQDESSKSSDSSRKRTPRSLSRSGTRSQERSQRGNSAAQSIETLIEIATPPELRRMMQELEAFRDELTFMFQQAVNVIVREATEINQLFDYVLQNFFLPLIYGPVTDLRGVNRINTFIIVAYERLRHLFRNGIWNVSNDEVREEINRARAEFNGQITDLDNRLLEGLYRLWFRCYAEIVSGTLTMSELEYRHFSELNLAARPVLTYIELRGIIRRLCWDFDKWLGFKSMTRAFELIESAFYYYRIESNTQRNENINQRRNSSGGESGGSGPGESGGRSFGRGSGECGTGGESGKSDSGGESGGINLGGESDKSGPKEEYAENNPEGESENSGPTGEFESSSSGEEFENSNYVREFKRSSPEEESVRSDSSGEYEKVDSGIESERSDSGEESERSNFRKIRKEHFQKH